MYNVMENVLWYISHMSLPRHDVSVPTKRACHLFILEVLPYPPFSTYAQICVTYF